MAIKRKNKSIKKISRKILDKEDLFVEAYLGNGFNASRAMRAAGYKYKSGECYGVEGHRILNKPNVSAKISARIKEVLSNAEITTVRWLEEVQRIAFFDIRKLASIKNGKLIIKDFVDLDDDIAAIISGVETDKSGNIKLKLCSKEKCLDLLGKYLSLYTDNHNILIGKEKLDSVKRRERILEIQNRLKNARSA